MFSGHIRQRILLVGQAPGPVERDVTRPFAGRAGRQLMRWFERAGLGDEAAARDRVYMTSMTTCFPGRTKDGSGDRRPSAREVALCGEWLDSLLPLLRPRLLLCVGGLSASRFLPGRRLDDIVGRAFTARGEEVTVAGDGTPSPPRGGEPEEPVLLPLPHPSGQSRWLNEPARMELLERALGLLGRLAAWAER